MLAIKKKKKKKGATLCGFSSDPIPKIHFFSPSCSDWNQDLPLRILFPQQYFQFGTAFISYWIYMWVKYLLVSYRHFRTVLPFSVRHFKFESQSHLDYVIYSLSSCPPWVIHLWMILATALCYSLQYDSCLNSCIYEHSGKWPLQHSAFFTSETFLCW